jgi:UDP-N-acetylglucosamine--N-acetylmuramyl-(pentapeptide) pyrophosphoryl-undecaprenol N-acetylglucosamine transferase
MFLISGRDVEKTIISRAGLPYRTTGARMIHRTGKVRNLLLPFFFVLSLVRSMLILCRFRPDVAVGTGGYASVPPILVARLMGVPVLVQEQNSYPGVATRLLARMAAEVHLAFAQAERYLKPGIPLRVTGNPVRKKLSGNGTDEDRKFFGLDPHQKTILVFGGSQGARSINVALVGALPLLEKEDCQIIWITGKNEYGALIAAHPVIGEWTEKGRLFCTGYLYEMERAYNVADLVVSRAGALTLAEITLAGLPSILVPYPYAAAGHQLHNARALAEPGAAVVLEQKHLSGPVLAEAIKGLLFDDGALRKMGDAARNAAFPEAAEKIVDAIVRLAGKRSKRGSFETR